MCIDRKRKISYKECIEDWKKMVNSIYLYKYRAKYSYLILKYDFVCIFVVNIRFCRFFFIVCKNIFELKKH